MDGPATSPECSVAGRPRNFTTVFGLQSGPHYPLALWQRLSRQLRRRRRRLRAWVCVECVRPLAKPLRYERAQARPLILTAKLFRNNPGIISQFAIRDHELSRRATAQIFRALRRFPGEEVINSTFDCPGVERAIEIDRPVCSYPPPALGLARPHLS